MVKADKYLVKMVVNLVKAATTRNRIMSWLYSRRAAAAWVSRGKEIARLRELARAGDTRELRKLAPPPPKTGIPSVDEVLEIWLWMEKSYLEDRDLPDGEWYKRFSTFVIQGKGGKVLSPLKPGEEPRGVEID